MAMVGAFPLLALVPGQAVQTNWRAPNCPVRPGQDDDVNCISETDWGLSVLVPNMGRGEYCLLLYDTNGSDFYLLLQIPRLKVYKPVSC